MLLFFADAHGNFEELLDIAGQYPQSSIEGIFLLGDQTPSRPLTEELASLGDALLHRTWFLLGNHDVENDLYLENHFCLWEQHLHSRVVTVGGLRIGGISGVFHEDVWLPPLLPRWRQRSTFAAHLCPTAPAKEVSLPRAHWATLFPEDLPDPFAGQAVDILITHEATGTHRRGFAALDQAAQHSGASLVLHGHLHEDYDATLNKGARVYGLGKQQIFIFTAGMWDNLISRA